MTVHTLRISRDIVPRTSSGAGTQVCQSYGPNFMPALLVLHHVQRLVCQARAHACTAIDEVLDCSLATRSWATSPADSRATNAYILTARQPAHYSTTGAAQAARRSAVNIATVCSHERR